MSKIASMSKKSSTCYGKKNGDPLTEYNSVQDAEEGAGYANTNYGSNLVPYLCPVCNQWHLSPKNRQTEVVNSDDGYGCNCVGSDGTSKDLYRTIKDATQRAKFLHEENGIRLQVYMCGETSMWHLTHRENSFSGSFSSKESAVCFRRSGKALAQYETYEDAKVGADYAFNIYGGDEMIPYECPNCYKWHLKPSTSSKKSTVCFGRSGKALTEYETYQDAEDGADYAFDTYGGNKMVPYECQMIPYECPTCYKWHLRPAASTGRSFSSKKSTVCFGRSGKALTEYETYEDAEDGVDYAFDRYGGNKMVPFECQTCYKWHLTPC